MYGVARSISQLLLHNKWLPEFSCFWPETFIFMPQIYRWK